MMMVQQRRSLLLNKTPENKIGTYQAFARGNDTGCIYMINTMTGETYHLGIINNPIKMQWRKQTKDDVFK